jgi:hypothetical protein
MIDRRIVTGALLAGAATFMIGADQTRAQTAPRSPVRNVVLVHGLYADGSCWLKVIPLLQKAGLNVAAVQNPLRWWRGHHADGCRSESHGAGLLRCACAWRQRGLCGARQDISRAAGQRWPRSRRRLCPAERGGFPPRFCRRHRPGNGPRVVCGSGPCRRNHLRRPRDASGLAHQADHLSSLNQGSHD